MNVTFVNRYFYPDHSATSQLLTDLTLSLIQQNVQVCVVTGRQLYDNPTANLPPQDALNGIEIYRVWATRFGRHHLLGRLCDYLTFYLSSTVALWKHIRAGDIVVTKTDPPLISVVGSLVSNIRGAIHVNWIQDLFPEIGTALGVSGLNRVDGLLRLMRNVSLRRARWNVVLGSRMAERLKQEGVHAGRIKIIHNWADGGEIIPVEPNANSLRTQWRLDRCFVIGYSGNIGRAHDFGAILEAAERLKQHEHIRFLFIGSGAQLDWLKQNAISRRLTNLLFQPYQPREQLRLTLSVPDVHLITLNPRLEGLIVPSKFYGITAAGRPVLNIGDPDGEIARLIRVGRCGFTITPQDADSLFTTIERLAQAQEECRLMGERARDLFEQRFDRADACKAWHATLQSSLEAAASYPGTWEAVP